MDIMKLEDLKGHDVYEFAYNSCAKNNLYWNESSIYVSDEDFYFLSKYLDQVIKNYPYYGRQKMYISEWNGIKNLVLKSEYEHEDIEKFSRFFKEVDLWIKADDEKLDFFWIYGI